MTKFFNPEIEYVTKLNFHNPNATELDKTLFSLKKSTILKKEHENANPITRFVQTKNVLIKKESILDEQHKKLINNIKIANLNTEHHLEFKKKSLEDKLKELRSEERMATTQLTICKKETSDYQIDVEFLGNYFKYTGFEDKLNKMTKTTSDFDNYEKVVKMKKLIEVI